MLQLFVEQVSKEAFAALKGWEINKVSLLDIVGLHTHGLVCQILGRKREKEQKTNDNGVVFLHASTCLCCPLKGQVY